MGLMADIAMFDCFLFFLHERSPIGKKQRQAKLRNNGKAFSYKTGVLF